VKVADLQLHLADLARLMQAAGAKEAAAEITAVNDGLSRFRGQSLRELAAALAPPQPGAARPVTPKPLTDELEAVAMQAMDVYERAADPSVTAEVIQGLVRRLGTLSKDGVAAVAERIGMKGVRSKSKAANQKAIRERIEARKGSSQRAGLIDRPG
jgi:hypothetical protein